MGDAFGDFAIFLNEFGHEVGAGVEHPQTTQTAIDGGNHASKIDTRLQPHNDGHPHQCTAQSETTMATSTLVSVSTRYRHP